ncbi:MAG: hypothetical protein LBU32_19980 [Clostridiales bacterium]|nr:hypothetical protein [Clostridiales bacterium]
MDAAWKADSAFAASLDLEVAAIQKKAGKTQGALPKIRSAPESGEGDHGAALKKRSAEDELQNARIELKDAKERRKRGNAAAAASKRALRAARKSLAALRREANEAEAPFIKVKAAAKADFIESVAESMPKMDEAAYAATDSRRACKRAAEALSKINCVYMEYESRSHDRKRIIRHERQKDQGRHWGIFKIHQV